MAVSSIGQYLNRVLMYSRVTSMLSSRISASLRRSLLLTFLTLSPLVFLGAECGADVFPNPPLADNSMRADVSVESSFAASPIEVKDKGSFWEVTADDQSGSFPQTVILEIPKRSDVPYSINVAAESNALIWYCVKKSTNLCTKYAASKDGGSGSITITSVGNTLAGTFRGTLRSIDGSESRTITNGEFKVDL